MVLIKGMEIPDSCYYCPLTSGGWHKDHGAWCDAKGVELPAGENARDCPLISLNDVIALMEARKMYVWESNEGCEWNNGIDACVAILRGLEGDNGHGLENRKTDSREERISRHI